MDIRVIDTGNVKSVMLDVAFKHRVCILWMGMRFCGVVQDIGTIGSMVRGVINMVGELERERVRRLGGYEWI